LSIVRMKAQFIFALPDIEMNVFLILDKHPGCLCVCICKHFEVLQNCINRVHIFVGQCCDFIHFYLSGFHNLHLNPVTVPSE
jgi:hypothetical protein